MRADEQIKAKNTLEAAISNNEEDIDELENHLKVEIVEHELVIIGLKVVNSILQDFFQEARFVLAESERKYEVINIKHIHNPY